jgi:hypothetical protein
MVPAATGLNSANSIADSTNALINIKNSTNNSTTTITNTRTTTAPPAHPYPCTLH